jgi:hypothetical protein
MVKKVWCYWEHLEEENENLWNTLGTQWELNGDNTPYQASSSLAA